MTAEQMRRQYEESVARVWERVNELSEAENKARRLGIHCGVFPGGQELAFSEGWLAAKEFYLE